MKSTVPQKPPTGHLKSGLKSVQTTAKNVIQVYKRVFHNDTHYESLSMNKPYEYEHFCRACPKTPKSEKCQKFHMKKKSNFDRKTPGEIFGQCQ